jgi:phosphate starvation-inducible protein PhoH
MPANQQRLTKRQKRTLKQQGVLEDGNKLSGNFNISKKIVPMTETQRDAFESWDYGNNLMLHGIAGTGKTFLGLYFALKDVMSKSSTREKVFIVRSTVPSRDQGFLPGSQKQKEAVYEEPYYDIATKLFERGDAYQILKQKQIVQFASTSYLRGCTFEDCIIVVDEVQNMSAGELHTIMTRVGENSRIIFCGDIKQDDLTSKRYNEESGLRDFMRIIERMKEFDFVEFQVEDIVRSRLVKSYIIERDKLGL